MAIWSRVALGLAGLVYAVFGFFRGVKGVVDAGDDTWTGGTGGLPIPHPSADDALPSGTVLRERRLAAAPGAIARFDADWSAPGFLSVAVHAIDEAVAARYRPEAPSPDLRWTEGYRALVEQERDGDSEQKVRREIAEYSAGQILLWDFRDEPGRLVLVVRVSAVRRERLSDAGTGFVVKEDPPGAHSSGEFWSFVRPITASERAHPAAMPGRASSRCLGCGAPIPAQYVPDCPYCGNALAGWPGGWLLAGMSRTAMEYQAL